MLNVVVFRRLGKEGREKGGEDERSNGGLVILMVTTHNGILQAALRIGIHLVQLGPGEIFVFREIYWARLCGPGREYPQSWTCYRHPATGLVPVAVYGDLNETTVKIIQPVRVQGSRLPFFPSSLPPFFPSFLLPPPSSSRLFTAFWL